jgi:hypothetical protein
MKPSTVSMQAETGQHDMDSEHLEVLGGVLSKRLDDWIAAKAASGVETRWKEDLNQYNGRDSGSGTMDVAQLAAGMGQPGSAGQTATRSTVFVNITRPKTAAAEARLANMLCPTDDRNFSIRPTPSPSLSSILKDEMAAAMPIMIGSSPAFGQSLGVNMTPTAAPVGGDTAFSGLQPTMPGTPMEAMAPMAGMDQASLQGGGMQPMGQVQQGGSGGAPPAPAPLQLSPMAQAAQELLKEAMDKAKAMETEIDDLLVEADWNAQVRSMLHDCAQLGTGVLKGPVVIKKTNKVWAQTEDPSVWALKAETVTTVETRRVSPWYVWPDPACGEDVHAGSGVFELVPTSEKQLRELAKQPGYIKQNIQKVLEQSPRTPKVTGIRDMDDPAKADVRLYEVFEYWGELSPRDLRACGCDIEDSSMASLSGGIVMVNGTVIKGFLHPLEGGALPYDFMQWEKADNSPWGFGVPYLCRAPQRVLNGAWRQIMDNASLAVGPNVIVKRGVVEPANGRWELTGRKVWYCTDASIPVTEAFTTFEMPAHIEEFQAIIELALRFIDEETGVPQIMAGGEPQNVETLGGMTMLMNSANVVLTRLAKQFDDSIIRRHIRRYYDYLMEHSPKMEIKGDFQVEPRGSTALLVKDQQAQALLALGNFQGSPLIAPIVHWNKWFSQVLKLQHIDPLEIMKTESEIAADAEKAAQNPQPDPNAARAQATIEAAKIKAQADIERTQIETQGEQAYIGLQEQQQQLAHQARLTELQMKHDLAMVEYANKHQLTIEEVKADLAKVAMVEDTKRQTAAMKVKADEESDLRKMDTQLRMKEADMVQGDRHKAIDADQADRHKGADLAHQQKQHEDSTSHQQKVNEDTMSFQKKQHTDQTALAKQQAKQQASAKNKPKGK